MCLFLPSKYGGFRCCLSHPAARSHIQLVVFLFLFFHIFDFFHFIPTSENVARNMCHDDPNQSHKPKPFAETVKLFCLLQVTCYSFYIFSHGNESVMSVIHEHLPKLSTC